MHAEHAEPLRIGRRIGAEPHQRRCDRITGEPHEFAQQVARHRAGIDDAAAGVEQRTLGSGDHLDRGFDFVRIALQLRPIGLVLDILRPLIHAFCELNILRNIDHHRTGPAVGRDVESFVQHARQVFDILHQIIVLGAGARDADGVAFLEGIVADQVRRHLSGDADDRNRIHQRVGQAGHRIGGAGAGGHQHAADLAGGARIAFRRMHRALLVADEDVLDVLLLEQFIIDRQHRAAGIAEEVLHALIAQGFDHHFRAAHFLHHRPTPHSLLSRNKKGLEAPVSAHRHSQGFSLRRCAPLRAG